MRTYDYVTSLIITVDHGEVFVNGSVVITRASSFSVANTRVGGPLHRSQVHNDRSSNRVATRRLKFLTYE